MSSGADRRDEQFARAVVGQVTGATVTRTDHKNAPAGTVDGRLDYLDGRTGALEISTLGLPSEFELEARIRNLDSRLPMPGRWKWVVKVADPNELPRILAIYASAILTCEAHGVVRVDDLPGSVVSADPDLEWLWAESTSSLFGIKLPDGAQDSSGYIDLSYQPVIAAWHSGPDQVVAGVNTALTVDPLARRVAKLVRAGGDERHLFLRVTFSGLEESALVRLIQHSMSLEDAEPLQGDPDLPEAIDYLWLLTGWGQRVTRWTRGEGWDHPGFN
jgi:hypothetical protein